MLPVGQDGLPARDVVYEAREVAYLFTAVQDVFGLTARLGCKGIDEVLLPHSPVYEYSSSLPVIDV